MANRLKGEIAVELTGEGDTKRTVIFRLGINELISLQKDYGLETDDAGFLAALDNQKSLRRRRLLVRAAMLARQPDTTEEQAGEVITELGIRKTDEVIEQTLQWALPDKSQASQGPTKGKGAAASPGTQPS